jgi:hypothetical protein
VEDEMSDATADGLRAGPGATAARDYSLTGPSARHAIEAGLAAADWYHTDVPRKVMKDLMQRTDGPAIRDTILWIVLHIVFAAGGIYFWGSWAAVPFWLAYGVCTARPAIRAGTNAGTARPSARAG